MDAEIIEYFKEQDFVKNIYDPQELKKLYQEIQTIEEKPFSNTNKYIFDIVDSIKTQIRKNSNLIIPSDLKQILDVKYLGQNLLKSYGFNDIIQYIQFTIRYTEGTYKEHDDTRIKYTNRKNINIITNIITDIMNEYSFIINSTINVKYQFTLTYSIKSYSDDKKNR
jgi:hypothetical protein